MAGPQEPEHGEHLMLAAPWGDVVKSRLCHSLGTRTPRFEAGQLTLHVPSLHNELYSLTNINKADQACQATP